MGRGVVSSNPCSQEQYGVSGNIFVNRKPRGDSVIIGGMAEEHGRWTRVLTQHAAKMLWFKLTGLLFPERAATVTGVAVTSALRGNNLPTITTRLETARTADNYIEIMGWAGEKTWWVRLPENEARTLWTRLDKLLFPVGWEGRKTRPLRPDERLKE